MLLLHKDLCESSPDETEKEARSQWPCRCDSVDGWSSKPMRLKTSRSRSAYAPHKVYRQRLWNQMLGKASESELLSELSDLSPNGHVAPANHVYTKKQASSFELIPGKIRWSGYGCGAYHIDSPCAGSRKISQRLLIASLVIPRIRPIDED